MQELRVIFRKFADGDVIALFPELAGDMNPYTCLSYMHIGQHSAASLDLTHTLKLATPDEYGALYDELRGIYETGEDAVRLKIAKKMTRRDFLKRKEQVTRTR